MSEKVVVHEESTETEAQIVVGFLRSCGIEAMISEDDAGNQLPSLEGMLGVKVFVSVDDAERARELLAERHAVADDDEFESDGDAEDQP